MNVGDVVTY